MGARGGGVRWGGVGLGGVGLDWIGVGFWTGLDRVGGRGTNFLHSRSIWGVGGVSQQAIIVQRIPREASSKPGACYINFGSKPVGTMVSPQKGRDNCRYHNTYEDQEHNTNPNPYEFRKCDPDLNIPNPNPNDIAFI